MNKSVDERLVRQGEYVDAMNVRLGSTENTEIGSVENSKGNKKYLSRDQNFWTKFNKTDYSGFEKLVDTSLHFTVNTNAKSPLPNPYGYGYYGSNKDDKDYEEKTKSTTYSTKANEQIEITRTKFHDLQMFHNIDSLWQDVERKANGATRYYTPRKKFRIFNRSKAKKDDIYSYSFKYTDSNSAKQVMVKNILKKGVLFELKTLIDSICSIRSSSFSTISTPISFNIIKPLNYKVKGYDY